MAERPVGEVSASLRITTDKTAGDVRRELDEVGRDVDRDMEDIGEDAGDSFDKGIKKSTKNTGRDMARAISAGIEREGVRLVPTKITTQFDSSGTAVRRWVTESLIPDTERAIGDAASAGAFKKVGETFSTAIGAGFNVSGKSPLIALLIPVIGIIGELIGAAVQAAGALSALLFIVPNLVFAIGLQAGVLLLAFNGIGEAIQGAFAATNVDEFNKALEKLTPAAKNFVGQIVLLRDVFKPLQQLAQENFFKAFGNTLGQVFRDTGGLVATMNYTVGQLSTSLGLFARTLVGFLADPAFLRFVSWIVPQITTWLEGFGPAMLNLLTGLSNIGYAVLPLFVWFGEVVNTAFSDFGQWLSDLSTDQDFLNWLEEVKTTLAQTWEVLVQAGAFIKTFVEQLDDAGGSKFLTDLATQLEHLTTFLGTDEGKKALEGLIHVIQILAYLFIFFVNDIILFLFLIEVTAEFIRHGLLPAIGEFFEWLGKKIIWLVNFLLQIPASWLKVFQWLGQVVSDWGGKFVETILGWAFAALDAVGRFIGGIIEGLFTAAAEVIHWFQERWNDVTSFFSSLGGRIQEVVGGLWNTLYEAGRNLLGGLINGVLSMFGRLGQVVSEAAAVVRSYWPFSPAEVGPLSGAGDPLVAGQKIIQRIAEGIAIETPALASATSNAASTVNVGTGAVQMNYYGQPPAVNQSIATAGGSLAEAIAQRQMAAMVRSLTPA